MYCAVKECFMSKKVYCCVSVSVDFFVIFKVSLNPVKQKYYNFYYMCNLVPDMNAIAEEYDEHAIDLLSEIY